MKFNKISILAVALIALFASAFSGMAQGLGADTFKEVHTFVLTPTFNINAGTALYTNAPFDKAYINGVGKIDFLTFTNTASTVLTATIYGSPDKTNWTSLPGYAIITNATSIVTTNYYWGATNFYTTNSELNPYTTTYPVAATAGYATPYPAEGTLGVFTNTGAISLNGYPEVEVGVNLTDLPRYIEIVYAASGTGTNITTAAILTAPK